VDSRLGLVYANVLLLEENTVSRSAPMFAQKCNRDLF